MRKFIGANFFDVFRQYDRFKTIIVAKREIVDRRDAVGNYIAFLFLPNGITNES